jgi:hypothetical protein
MKTLFIIGFTLILSFIVLLSYFIPIENVGHNRFSFHNIRIGISMMWKKYILNS